MKFRKGLLKKAGVAALFISAGVLQGCATPTYNYVAQTQNISEPPLGSINTAYIGEPMLRQGQLVMQDAFELRSQVTVGSLGTYTLRPGQYAKTGQDGDKEFYSPVQASQVIKNAIADPWQSIMLRKGKPGICVITIFNAYTCEDNTTVQRAQINSTSNSSFQQTLLYNGQVGNKINVGYREFSSNLARPAFNNDVEYDLAASKVIGYKGARLEVLKATNESIQYRVIQHFNNNN